jgi:hypothetical protein
MTTVYGFSEMKGVTCWARIVARRSEVGGLGVAVEITAGAAPVRFEADVGSVVGKVVSATSTQGPQWDDETGIAMADTT